jgi:hypothetical protein
MSNGERTTPRVESTTRAEGSESIRGPRSTGSRPRTPVSASRVLSRCRHGARRLIEADGDENGVWSEEGTRFTDGRSAMPWGDDRATSRQPGQTTRQTTANTEIGTHRRRIRRRLTNNSEENSHADSGSRGYHAVTCELLGSEAGCGRGRADPASTDPTAIAWHVLTDHSGRSPSGGFLASNPWP